MTVDEMIERSHKMAVEKGWWEGGAPSVADLVNNFHAEISEAWEEYRAGRMETWYAARQINEISDLGVPRKPEGFWVEIADLCIRVADTMGAYGWQYQPLRASDLAKIAAVEWALPTLIATLHICAGCLGIDRNGDIGAGFEPGSAKTASGCLEICFGAAVFHRVDLWAIIELKMAYNTTRSHRHGGKKA